MTASCQEIIDLRAELAKVQAELEVTQKQLTTACKVDVAVTSGVDRHDFDYAVLGRIDDLETELAKVRAELSESIRDAEILYGPGLKKAFADVSGGSVPLTDAELSAAVLSKQCMKLAGDLEEARAELTRLKTLNESLAERVAAQSELLTKKAERSQPQ